MIKITTFIIFFFSSFIFILNAQSINEKTAIPDSTKSIQIVEASCGQCQFKLPGKDCSLAIRIRGKIYFVDGTSIDDHGNAHASDGFCSAIRSAEIQGKVVKRRFIASYFKLIKPGNQESLKEN